MGPVHTITELIPQDVLHRFLRRQMRCKVLLVAVSGAHAHGYPHSSSPLELKGLHVEPTERLVGINPPPRAYNWVGEFETRRIDFSSLELGPAIDHLIRGDGSILERILAPRQLIGGEDLKRLQKAARTVICRRFHAHYRNFSKGVLRDYDEGEKRSVSHLLGAYRTGLSGVHLFRKGEVVLELMPLAKEYGFVQIEELVRLNREVANAVVDEGNIWINRLVRLQALLEESYEFSELAADPADPRLLESYLLDMRRRFFDAMTVQES